MASSKPALADLRAPITQKTRVEGFQGVPNLPDGLLKMRLGYLSSQGVVKSSRVPSGSKVLAGARDKSGRSDKPSMMVSIGLKGIKLVCSCRNEIVEKD